MPSPSVMSRTTACFASSKAGRSSAEIPNTALADEGPVYKRPLQPPASIPISPIDLYAFLDGSDDATIQKFLDGKTPCE